MSALRLPPTVAVVVLMAACGGDEGTQAGGGRTTTTGERRAPDQAGAQADLELGEQVFSANCAACHGEQGQGGAGPELAGGRVVDRYPAVEDHQAVVVKGRAGMPAWGDRLSDEEIDAVVQYEREGL